jgi:TonB-linked SusC/RagA family outer membrane protein
MKKLMVLAMICSTCTGRGQSNPFNVGHTSLEHFLNVYEQVTKINVVYTSGLVKGFGDSVQMDHVPNNPESALKFAFRDQRFLTYAFTGRNILSILRKSDKAAQKPSRSLAGCILFQGRIMNNDGEPLDGATVKIKGTTRGTCTNGSGYFTMARCRQEKLVLSSVGYKSIEIPWKDTAWITVILERDVRSYDPAIVKAYEDPFKIITPPRRIKPDYPVNNNLLENFRGQVPSMNIVTTSGMPGASQFVNIRGYNSIGRLAGWTNRPPDDPLIVVDGVPLPTLLRPLNRLSSMAGNPQEAGISNGGLNPLFTLNPLDVESIEVLKDAASTAIYGSRGANGVIVIRTKMASATTPTLTYASFTGFGKITAAMDMMNTRQYLDMRYQAFKNDNIQWWLPGIAAPDLKLLDTTRYTNWKKWLLGGTAKITDQYITFSNRKKQFSYFISGGYHNETSVMPGDISGRRISITSDVSYRSKNKKFNAGFTAFRTNTTNKWITDNAMNALLLVPHAPEPRHPDGTLKWEENNASFLNPESYYMNTLIVKNSNTLVHTHGMYKFSKSLKGEISLGYDNMATHEEARFPRSAKNPASNPTGALTEFDNNYRLWNIEPQLEHNFYDTVSSLKIQTIIGASWLNQVNNQLLNEQGGFTNDDSLGIPDSHTTSTITPNNLKYKYFSGFARVNVLFQNRYQLNLTFRSDGSSRFGENARRASFGSVGAGWIIKKQDTVEQKSILGVTKLRGSFGVTGSDQIDDYGFLNNYTRTAQQYQGWSSIVPSALARPDYRWIVTKKFDIALESSLFNGLVDVTVQYYLNRTTDQLINHFLPVTTGFTSITDNLPAVVQNSGFELEAHIHKAWNNYAYSGRLILSTLRNQLKSFPDLQQSNYSNSLVVGKSLTVEKGHLFGGVDKDNGQFIKKDSAEPGVIGHHDPVVLGGFVQSIRFFNFQLQTVMELQIKKATVYMVRMYNLLPPGRKGDQLYMNQPAALANNHWEKPGDQARWQKFGTKASGPTYNSIPNYTNSNVQLVNASVLLLKNVQLTYEVKGSFIKKYKIKNLKLFTNGENLLMITPYKGTDPQINDPLVLPPLKVITAGLILTF